MVKARHIHLTCNCARHMTIAGMTHYDSVVHIMKYCMATPEIGLVLKPYCELDGTITDYKFEVTVKTDSDDAKCQDTRRSVTGSVVYLNGVPEILRCSTQKMVSLSTTEAELNAAVMRAKCIVLKKILKSLGLKVKLPLLTSIDNGGAVDIGKDHVT